MILARRLVAFVQLLRPRHSDTFDLRTVRLYGVREWVTGLPFAFRTLWAIAADEARR